LCANIQWEITFSISTAHRKNLVLSSTAGQLSDIERSAFLKSKGIRLVRFENRHVFEETEWVLDVIRSNFRYGPPVEQKTYAPHKSLRTTQADHE
jgi:hypothetical protein